MTVRRTDASLLDGLFRETRRFFRRLVVAAEELHHADRITPGLRGILFGLVETGPRTVPDMARARRVSRQHIQSHVNELRDRGLVEYEDNPAHRKSHFVRLTPRGRKLVQKLRRRETRVFGALSLGVDERGLRTATEVLVKLREAMESPAWEEVVRREAGR